MMKNGFQKRHVSVTKWLLFLFIVTGLTLNGCKDYDDDIDNLQSQIDETKTALASLKALVDAGKVISNVENTTDGIKLTFSDGTSQVIQHGKDGVNGTNGVDGTNGTNGNDGASFVVKIGEDGYWYINNENTGVVAKGQDGAQGEKGEQGEKGDKGDQGDQGDQGEQGTQGEKGDKGDQGEQGSQGEKGDKGDQGEQGTQGEKGETPTIEIGENGNWFIDGEDTQIPADATLINGGKTLMAVMSEDGNYYEFYYMVNGEKVEEGAIFIPVVSQYVSSIVFVPEYLDSNIPVIYAPFIKDGSNNVYASKVALTYQLNPAGVAEDNFEVVGLAITKATALRSAETEYIEATKVSYSAGTLVVEVSSDKFKYGTGNERYLYALVLNNTMNDGNEEKAVYSSYVSLAAESLAQIDGTTITVDAEDKQVAYNSAEGVKIVPVAYYGAQKELNEELFNVAYTYTLKETGGSYFECSADGVVKVKNNQAAAIGKTATVEVKMTITNAAGRKIERTKNVVVTATSATTPEPPLDFNVLLSKDLSYTIGACDIKSEKYDMDQFYNAAGISKTDFERNESHLDSVSIAGKYPALITSNIRFDIDDNKLVLVVPSNVEAEKYIVSRTYKIDNKQWQVKYVVDLSNPTLTINRKADSWAGNTLNSFGRPVSTIWEMAANMRTAYEDVEGIVTIGGSATCGTNLSFSKVTFELVNPLKDAANVSITSGDIKLVDKYENYVDKEAIKVKAIIELNNGLTKEEEFEVLFKNPIKVEYAKNVSFKIGDDLSKLSPMDGLKITNLTNGYVFVDEKDVHYKALEQFVNGGLSGITGTQVKNNDNRLTVDFGSETITWTPDGVVLNASKEIVYDVKVNTVWSGTIETKEGLKVTVNPL